MAGADEHLDRFTPDRGGPWGSPANGGLPGNALAAWRRYGRLLLLVLMLGLIQTAQWLGLLPLVN